MTRILVVGAGPTGLALALQAHDHGAEVRVVERREQAWRPSRALILHTRTLEVLRPLGVVDPLLAMAVIAPEIRLHLGSRTVPVRLGEFALPDTAYPHLSLVRQTDVETVLANALRDRGVSVERAVEFVGLHPDRASLRSAAGPEDADCDYLVGCDGASSAVRAATGIRWRGGGYREEIVLADAELRGDLEPGVAHVAAGRAGIVIAFPIGEHAAWRLLASRPAAGDAGAAVEAHELQALLDAAHVPADVTALAWSSRVRLDHRLADAYRKGRVFLAGDAAHVHSPAGGQGMNTGVQDAINLGWKLAYAPNSVDPNGLLDSYQQERRPVARTVLALTDLAFWAESSPGPLASLARGVLAPLCAPLVPAMLGQRRLLAEGFRTISQLRVAYRDSPLSVDRARAGRPRAGDRLPDATVTVAGRRTRVHELIARPGVHVLLDRDAREPAACGVEVFRLTDVPGAGLVAVRPDGYVGLRSDRVDDVELRQWLHRAGALAA